MKFYNAAKLLFLSLVCALAMVACSKDDDSGKSPSDDDVDPYYAMKTLNTIFHVEVSDDFKEIVDLTCVVTDYKGNKKNYTWKQDNIIEVTLSSVQPNYSDSWSVLTRAPWINLPVEASIELKPTMRQGLTLDAERTYKLSVAYNGRMSANNAFDYALASKDSYAAIESEFVGGEGMAEWIEEHFPSKYGFECNFANETFVITEKNGN